MTVGKRGILVLKLTPWIISLHERGQSREIHYRQLIRGQVICLNQKYYSTGAIAYRRLVAMNILKTHNDGNISSQKLRESSSHFMCYMTLW